MALSNTTTLNDLVGQIVSEQAIGAAYNNRVMRPLISGRVVPPGNSSIVIPKFGSMAVGALTEGVAPSSTTLSTDGVTLTPVERGIFLEVSKRVLYADPWQDLAPYGDQLGRALGQDEDSIILAAMLAGAGAEINAAGDALVLADFLAAISKLEAENAPGPYFAVFHPYSWAKMRALISDAGAYGNVGKQTVEGFGQGFTHNAGYVGSPFGVPCFVTTGVTAHGTDTSERANFVFSQSAVGAAWMKDISIDVDDNVVARKIDMMAWYSIDADVLKSEWIVTLRDTLTA